MRLEEKLKSCQGIIDYVIKYVAHSSTPESLAIQNIQPPQITLKHLWDAHQIIYEVSEFLSVILYSESHSPLIWTGPNLFENWDTSLVEHKDVARLEATHEKYKNEIDKWRLVGDGSSVMVNVFYSGRLCLVKMAGVSKKTRPYVLRSIKGIFYEI